MAGAWTTIEIRDANGDALTMRAWDESGTDDGPFSFGQVFSDGTGSASQPGQVGSPGDVVALSLTVDTNAYVSGDVLADTQTITDAMRIAGGHGVLQSVILLDPEAQAQPLDLYFFNVNRALGTENGAPSISDTNLADCIGIVAIEAANYHGPSSAKIAVVTGIGLMLEAASGSRDLYVGAVTRGTPTHAGGALPLKLGFLWD